MTTATLQAVTVSLPDRDGNHATAARNGWPTAPFQARLAPGRPRWVFWHHLMTAQGDVLDLPPMYLVQAASLEP